MTLFVVPGLSEAACAILARSRNYGLYLLNRARLLAGTCPFCEHNLMDTVAQNEDWTAKKSPGPEANTKLHFIIFSRRHVSGLMELPDSAGASLMAIVRAIYGRYGITASGILTRDGNPIELAGTVDHCHIHIMVPNGMGRVETPIAKGEADEEAGRQRAVIYEQLFQGTLRPEDFSDLQAFIVDSKRLEGYNPTA